MNFGFIISGALLDKGGVLFFAVTYGLSIDCTRLPLWSVGTSQCWALLVNDGMSVNCDDHSDELVG